ncbi:unnamed protein product [Chondrus crispus]|uniref:Uncharacterized protein n=1 Tax=Chondrus crispus TaxID=2769 RepID=R7Q9J9_CHOCR|nr:unnamed protein product [Chondrus crispus]CDF34155.1 unnamed protein product [Chondrus crispus]|eukprot:XP_005713974.1 unnamed protein product [Chondrus crispus]
MRFASALVVLAYAFHTQAWRFDIQGMFESGPLTFLRRPSQDNHAAAEEVEPKTLLRHNEFRDGQIQLSNLPCVLDDIQTIGACLCAEARDLEGIRFTRRDTALCTSLLQLEPELWRQRCDVFTDSNGNVQRFRLVHVVFKTLAECKPERVEKETRIARRRLATSDCTGEECNKSTTDEVRANAMQPQVRISGLRMYIEGLNGIGDDLTSGTAEELTSSMAYVERRVRQSKRFQPNKQGNITASLEVLLKIGKKISSVLVPLPPALIAKLRGRKYRVECKWKNGKLSRVTVTRKKVELMMNNWVEVELPLRTVKDESYLDGTDRQRGRVKEPDTVGVTKCRVRRAADRELTVTCECRRLSRRDRRDPRNGNPAEETR